MPNPNLPIGGDYNVYIGARYVPLVMGAWSATVNYEPLSIVTFEGNSYTSKTFVPAGTPVSNETYWAATGNYNAQVELYRQEVLKLEKNVSNLTSTVNNLNTDMGKLNPLSAHYLIVGDSYLEWNPPTWGTVAMSSIGIPSSNYTIISKSGIGIAYPDPLTSMTIQEFITDWVENNPSIYSNISRIIIMCGYNDRNQSNLSNKIIELINYLKNTFPNAKYYLGMNGSTTLNPQIADELIEVATQYYGNWTANGGTYIPRAGNVLSVSGAVGPDGIHPTQIGQLAMGRYLANYLLSGTTQYLYQSSIPFTANGGTGTVNISQVYSEGEIFTFIDGALTFDTPLAKSEKYYDLGTLIAYPQNDAYLLNGNIQCRFQNKDEYQLLWGGTMTLTNNHLNLYCPLSANENLMSIVFTVSSTFNRLPN